MKVFNIDAMIKEAVDYVTPKEESREIPDPKTRNKKGVVDQTPIDPFDGKEVEGYKKLAEFFRKKITDMTQPDLCDQINDDGMLCELVIERLSLEYFKSADQSNASSMGDYTNDSEMR